MIGGQMCVGQTHIISQLVKRKELQATNMVQWNGIEDGPSSMLGGTLLVGCIVNPCAVVLKQAMEDILFLDQLRGKNHMAKLVFLVQGNLREFTAIGNYRTRLFIQRFRTRLLIHAGTVLFSEGSIHIELLILNLVG